MPKVNSDLILDKLILAIGNTPLRKIAELTYEKWYLKMKEMKREVKYPITLEIDKAFKMELDKRSERMKLDSHRGYSWEETISYLEEKVGIKIQIINSLKMKYE